MPTIRGKRCTAQQRREILESFVLLRRKGAELSHAQDMARIGGQRVDEVRGTEKLGVERAAPQRRRGQRAVAGLPRLRLEITELDININGWNATPEEQATVTNNILEGAFERLAVDGVTVWGMNDFHHWRDDSIMFDDLDEATNTRIAPILKPSGQIWIVRVVND